MEEVACRKDDGKAQAPHEAGNRTLLREARHGFVHDPKRAVRGAIYRRTTFSLFDLMKPKRERR